MKYDIIIGNPPYQGTHKKAAKLWPQFFKKSMELLKNSGMLIYVAPATWLNKAPRGAWSILKEWDITRLVSDASSWFPGVASSFAIVTMVKRAYGGTTTVDNDFELNLHIDSFPALNTELNRENIEFIKEMQRRHISLDVKNGSNIQIDDHRLSETQTSEHVFETYYSSAKNRRSIWCSENHGDYGKLKLVVGLYGNPLKTPEITTKAAGAKSKYILGDYLYLEKILKLIQSEDNMKWTKLMTTDAFSHPLTYIADEI